MRWLYLALAANTFGLVWSAYDLVFEPGWLAVDVAFTAVFAAVVVSLARSVRRSRRSTPDQTIGRGQSDA